MTENRKQLCLALLVGMLLGGGFISLLESYEDYRSFVVKLRKIRPLHCRK